jgi:leukotriene-A4 hydrolase
MRSVDKILTAAFLLILFSCTQNTMEQRTPQLTEDPHSFANPADAKVTHLRWSATVDFETRVISAVASWDITTSAGADMILFDTKNLKISKVTLDDGRPTEYKMAASDSILGQGLGVLLTPDTKKVNIYYETDPGAEALQWLGPSQTAGKKYPFLFTQSQAILARSWVPCQDSPGIHFTYDADLKVPSNLLALMSASNPVAKNDSGQYHFEMKQPISSYLLALSVGDIAFKEVSARSGIYAEPSMLEAATWEFADLEKMIAGAESLYGPYQWDRYDVLVLPPSFPFGGMENPRLTFATPTILAGDRSLTSLIAHELAHSWSGNLVTNATWNDFWLNEGFTVYFETRIMEKLYGKDYAKMLASLNLQDLHDEIASLTEAALQADTKLKLSLEGRNPDDGVTDIAYNKGYFFLRSIEEAHGRDKFDSFLKDYFTTNAFQSMDTDRFIDYITTYYQDKFGVKLDEQKFERWIFSEGLPDDCPNPNSSRFKLVDDVIAGWKAEQELDSAVARNWSTHEYLHFLKNLPQTLSPEQMKTVDIFGNFTSSGNAEIVSAWGVIAVRNKYERMYPKIETFLINTGRRKFLSPLYNELVKTPEGKARARKIYEKARGNYHFVATSTFDKLLN